MSLRKRLVAVSGVALAAVMLFLSTLGTTLAEADGDGFDGDELTQPLIPLILGPVIVIGLVTFLVVRGRAKNREGQN